MNTAIISEVLSQVECGNIKFRPYENGKDIMLSNPKLAFRVIDAVMDSFGSKINLISQVEDELYHCYNRMFGNAFHRHSDTAELFLSRE